MGYVGMMEKQMESTRDYRDYIWVHIGMIYGFYGVL